MMLKLLLISESGHSGQSDDVEHLLREASENCIRARNDAVDALIAYLHRYFSRVRRDYGTVLMNAYFPQFTELFVQLNAIARVVPESRSTERQRRNEIYDRIVQNDIPALRQLYEQIESSKDLIDEEAQRESHTQRKRERFNRSIGVIGAVLSAIGVALVLITL